MNFKYYPHQSEKYLTDFVKEDEVVSWDSRFFSSKSNNTVFISAPTGMGKTYFVENTLVRCLMRKNNEINRKTKILWIGNRVALTRQGKQRLAEKLCDITGNSDFINKIKMLNENGLDSFHDFGSIVVYSYQQLTNAFRFNNESFRKLFQENEFSYIVFDECHYFTSDALFNATTDLLLLEILKLSYRSLRIYMSATLEECYTEISLAESDLIWHLGTKIPEEKYYYYFDRNYNRIKNIFAYDNLERLVPKIKATPKDKWLIFVGSKKDGKNFTENLSETLKNDSTKKSSDTTERSVVFVTADSKKSSAPKNERNAYLNIIEEEKFEERVLISTAVLDNGVNIKDSTVKHIVIDILDRTQFIQMLGRLRGNSDSEINLYIRNYTDEDVEKYLVRDVKDLMIRLNLDRMKTKEHRQQYYETLTYPYDERRDSIFRFTGDSLFCDYNHYAIKKLLERIATFFKIIKVKNPDYTIGLEKLGNFRDVRAKLHNYYDQEKSSSNDFYLNRRLCQILESKSEREHRLSEYRYYHELYVNKKDPLMFGLRRRYEYYESVDLSTNYLNIIFMHMIPTQLKNDSVYYPTLNNMKQLITSEQLRIFENAQIFKRLPLKVFNYSGMSQTSDTPISNEDANLLKSIEGQIQFIHKNVLNKPGDFVFNNEQQKILKIFDENTAKKCKELFDISDSEYPALTEQVHWIERTDFSFLENFDDGSENLKTQSNQDSDNINFDYEKNDTPLNIEVGSGDSDMQENTRIEKVNPEFIFNDYSDKSDYDKIVDLIDRVSIEIEIYSNFSKENKENISFSNAELLDDKASLIGDVNETYMKILNWFSQVDNENYDLKRLATKFEKRPLKVEKNHYYCTYTLKIVRGTTAKNQLIYALFVKEKHDKN